MRADTRSVRRRRRLRSNRQTGKNLIGETFADQAGRRLSQNFPTELCGLGGGSARLHNSPACQRHITLEATKEIKFDGFRALAYIDDGKCRLVSRRRHEYKSFRQLQGSIAELPVTNAVLDGEIVCLDQYGRSQFYELMFRRGEPFFYAFDLLWLNGEDLRGLSLLERKRRLRKLCLQRHGSANPLLYLDHLEGNGSGLFAKACELDLEGIVAKWKLGQYVASDRRSSWVKIKNRAYSQVEGRQELFERA